MMCRQASPRRASGRVVVAALVAVLALAMSSAAHAGDTRDAAGDVSQAARPPVVPCGSCSAAVVTPRQVLTASDTWSLAGLLVLVRVTQPDIAEHSAAIAALRDRHARVGAIVEPTVTEVPGLSTAGLELIVIDVSRRVLDAELAFEVKSAASSIRGAGVPRVGLRLAVGQRETAGTLGLAPYVDLVVISGPPPMASGEEPFARIERWTVSDRPLRGAADAVEWIERASRDQAAGALAELADGAEGILPLLSSLAREVPGGLTPLPEVSVRCEGECRAASFLDAATLDAVIVVTPGAAGTSTIVAVPGATGMRAVLPERAGLVALPGAVVPWEVRAEGPQFTFTPPLTGRFVLRVHGWQGGEVSGFATGVDVRADRTLSVEEIVARHQAARARQESLVKSMIVGGTTVLTFDAPGFAAPVTVTAQTTIFMGDAATEVEQREIRVNGLALATRGDQIPRLPIIEPERVSTPPLVIALTDAYDYRLEGRDTTLGRPAYIVSFRPRTRERSLMAGRAWIDAATFGLVRIDATQTALPGPVVSSRQVDEFRPAAVNDALVWVPARSEFNQRYESASFATPIKRVVTLTSHQLNAADFAAQLDAAHRSDAVMMIETPDGYRYLQRRDRSSGAPAPAGGAAPVRTVTRDRAERVRTLAGGITWDPNISVPLIFAGLSYLDLNLFGTGAQLDAFFGGTYGRLAWSTAPFSKQGWRASGDAFGIALSYNDRAFRGGREQYRENVTQRPFHAAAGVVGPIGGAWRLRATYEMDYVHYGRADSTAREFRVPASTPVHGFRLAVERQRGAWTVAGWGLVAARQSWQAWGLPSPQEPVIRSFQRIGARATRAFVWSGRAVGRVELSWMDGFRLDRFSRYTFGTFDNPLRGYPSASIRYDRGAVLRSSASWTVTSRLRLDAFADLGVVRDPGRSPRMRSYPGIGAGAQFPAPFGLLMGAEWGYGTSGSTHVVKVNAYKVF